MDCQLCTYSQERTNVCYYRYNKVFNEQDLVLPINLMIVGDYVSNETEDLTGLPLVGASGQMLENMLNSVGLSSLEAYCTLLVKCKFTDKVDKNNFKICTSNYMDAQIEKIKPKVILSLGSVVGEYFLGKNFKITKNRGEVSSYRTSSNFEVLILPTYSPSYLLRITSLTEYSPKFEAWQDMMQLATILG